MQGDWLFFFGGGGWLAVVTENKLKISLHLSVKLLIRVTSTF